jgi:hypothetical protein
MPPKAANTARRKGPAFNPPRPVKPAAQTASTAKRATGPGASRPGAAKKPAASPSDFLPATAIISSDDEIAEEMGHVPSDLDQFMEDLTDDEDTRRAEPPQTETPPIPLPLLARLLAHNFEDDSTQIQKGAMNLFSTYMGIFVQEAIARAKDERSKAAVGGNRADALLQVEDLEKLTPQLVLDF